MIETTRVNEWNVILPGSDRLCAGDVSGGEEEKSAGTVEMEYQRYIAGMGLYGKNGLLLGDSKGLKEPN